MATFRQVPLTINVDTRRIVDPVTREPLATRDSSSVSAGDTVIMCYSFITNSGTAYPLSAGDAFEQFIDLDLERVLDSGVLDAGVSGTITSLDATGFTAAPANDTGSLNLVNANGDSETVSYTAWAVNTGVYTFTITSATLQFTYSSGDAVDIVDPVMSYAPNTSVDVPGDWTEISRSGGKISVRTDCTSSTFFDKLDPTKTREQGYIEIDRIPSGQTKPSMMLFDRFYVTNSLRRSGYPAVPTASAYLTATESEAMFAPIAGTSEIVTVGTIATGEWAGTAVAVAHGGTGATTSSTACANLSAPLITTSSDVPDSAPGKTGDLFINTAAPGVYVAGGNTTVTDWIKVN